MAETLAGSSLFPRLAARLPIGRVGKVFYAFETTGSTQDEIRRLAEAGAPEGTLVVADHQTRGRGRQGRRWLEEPGVNLLFSLLLRPQLLVSRIPQLSLLAAVATAETLGATTGLQVGIRWPNDLEVKERKVVGILLETETSGERVRYAILGIGINVNQTEFPADLRRPATSLAIEVGRLLDREELLEALLVSLDRWYTRYLGEGFSPVREGWRGASVTLGRVVDADGTTGTAEDLDVDGALLVRTAAGTRVRVVSGELR